MGVFNSKPHSNLSVQSYDQNTHEKAAETIGKP